MRAIVIVYTRNRKETSVNSSVLMRDVPSRLGSCGCKTERIIKQRGLLPYQRGLLVREGEGTQPGRSRRRPQRTGRWRRRGGWRSCAHCTRPAGSAAAWSTLSRAAAAPALHHIINRSILTRVKINKQRPNDTRTHRTKHVIMEPTVYTAVYGKSGSNSPL